MAHPALVYGGIAGGSALLNALFGGDDEFKMSPETRQIYNMLLGKYKTGDFGISPTERSNLLKRFRGGLQEESQRRTGSSLASLGRRGLLSSGQAAGITTDIGSSFGKAFGKGVTDIDIAGERIKSQEEQAILQMLTQLSGQSTFQPGQGIPGLEGMSSDLALLYMLSGKKPPGSDGGSIGSMDFGKYFRTPLKGS